MEGLINGLWTTRFELEQPPRNMTGKSGGLAYALAFAIKAIELKNGPSLAATGVVDERGGVAAVDGFVQKLEAALEVLGSGSLLLYPRANAGDLDDVLRKRAVDHGLELCAVSHVAEALAHLGVKLTGKYLERPYLGLDAFSVNDSGLFFGRSAEVREFTQALVDRGREKRPSLLIVGPSGSGKTSLLGAGILRRLQDKLPDVRWGILRPRDLAVIPETIPNGDRRSETGRLGIAAARSWCQDHGLAEALLGSCDGLDAASALTDSLAQLRARGRPVPFVWVLDQLEELFTLGLKDETIDWFAKRIHALLEEGVFILAAIRSDFFYERLQAHPRLLDVFGQEGIRNLLPAGGPALEQIITAPAEAAGYAFERDENGTSLAAIIRAEAGEGPGLLPLLEYALTELYRRRDKSRRVFTLDAYERIDRIRGAIGARAEAVYQGLDTEVQFALSSVVWALATTAGSSGGQIAAKSAPLKAFPPGTAERRLIDRFLAPDARLLVADSDGSGGDDSTTVRVAHEALFLHWQRARDILARDSADLELRSQLEGEAASWREDGSSADWSFPRQGGKRLADAEDLLGRREQILEDPLIAYVRANVTAVRRRARRQLRNLWLTVGITSMLAVAAGLGAWLGFVGMQRAERQLGLRTLKSAHLEFVTGRPASARSLLGQLDRRDRGFEWKLLATWVGPAPRDLDLLEPRLQPKLSQELRQLDMQQIHEDSGFFPLAFSRVEHPSAPIIASWIPEDCGGCAQSGIVERTSPATVMGGFEGFNRARIDRFIPTRDASAAYLEVYETYPDRRGTTLDGEFLTGCCTFLLPLRDLLMLGPPQKDQGLLATHASDIDAILESNASDVENSEANHNRRKKTLLDTAHAFGATPNGKAIVDVRWLNNSEATVSVLSLPPVPADYHPEDIVWSGDYRAQFFELTVTKPVPKVTRITSIATDLLDGVPSISPVAVNLENEFRRPPPSGEEVFAFDSTHVWPYHRHLERFADASEHPQCLKNAEDRYDEERDRFVGLFDSVVGPLAAFHRANGAWEIWHCKEALLAWTVPGNGEPDTFDSYYYVFQDLDANVSHDGSLIAVYPVGSRSTVGVFDVRTGKLVAKMEGPTGQPRSFKGVSGWGSVAFSTSELRFSPLDSHLFFYAKGSMGSPQISNREFFVWNSTTGQLVFDRPKWNMFEDVPQQKLDLSGPPERCQYEDTCGEDLPQWDGTGGELVKPVPAGVVYAPDESFVVLMEQQGDTVILDGLGGNEIARLANLQADRDDPFRAVRVSVSPNRDRVQIGNYILDGNSWEILLDINEPGKQLWLSPDWETAVIADSSGGLEFLGLGWADETVPEAELTIRDLMLRTEYFASLHHPAPRETGPREAARSTPEGSTTEPEVAPAPADPSRLILRLPIEGKVYE